MRSRNPSPGRKAAQGSHANGSLVLKTHVVKARNLAAKDRGGSSDPYLILTLGDTKDSTVSIPKSLNPEWNETIEFPVASVHSLLLEVVCWDKDRFSKDYMGEFDVPLEDVFLNGAVSTEPTWYPLESRKTGKKKSIVTGEVLLSFQLYDPLHSSATSQQILQKLTGITAALTIDDDDPTHLSLSAQDSLDPDDQDLTDEELSLAENDPEDASTNKTETPEKRRRRLRLAKLKRKAKQRVYEFSGVSDIDGVLFLEICKITDLPPEKNLTRTSFDMDPFVVSSLGKKTYRTRVVRHNLNPVYDEKLVFQVMRHEKNYSLKFSVVDRDSLSGNDFVGTVDLPLDKVIPLAPDADPQTGLYHLKEPESTTAPVQEGKKSRFRLPLSRTSSSTSIKGINARPAAERSATSSSTRLQVDAVTNAANDASATPSTEAPPIPHAVSAESADTRDDPDLRPFELPLIMKNKDRWESKHKPTLYLKAKYMPYRALRQQFWRAMLRQYDADDSGYISKVELVTMLDTLGSTLHESTIDSFFKRFAVDNSQGEAALTFDQAVQCLEELLQSLEEKAQKQRSNTSSKLAASQSGDSPISRAEKQDSSSSSTSIANSPGAPPTLKHDIHGSAGEEGEMIDGNDLADDGGEEHIVEIRECPICHLPRLSKKSDADILTHIATCASQDWRQVNNIVMAGFVTSSQAQRKWYSKVITKIGYGGYKIGANSANILVQDRITGQINEERMSVYVRLGIRLLYKGLKSRDMEKRRIRKLLRSLSFKQGRKFDDPASAAEIQSFINFHQLDMSEVLLPTDQFKSFNEFFYRALKPGARPCSAADKPEIVTSPCDCRSVVFNTITQAQSIWVKGREFSLERLFGNAYPEDVKRFTGGSLGIFRLAPQDYHRFHIPVDGVMGEPKPIDGEYYTVNPMAIRSALDVYGENVRVLVPIDSTSHGRVMVVCVGAMMVGSTVITRKAGDKVKRTEELGYFKFGGSTLLLLFEPGQMVFDADLVDNSNESLETLIRVGMSIGHSPHVSPHLPDMKKETSNATNEEKDDAKRRIGGSLAPDSKEAKKAPTVIM